MHTIYTMRSILLLVVLALVYAGDTSIPKEAVRVDVDPSYTFYYTVLYNQTLVVNVNTSRINFFGVGYRFGMINVSC